MLDRGTAKMDGDEGNEMDLLLGEVRLLHQQMVLFRVNHGMTEDMP